MFEWITDKDERGQVGIGTLIVFIAMVLVAAIAAGVLINTAGFLQSKGEQTGQQSSEQVTDRLSVVSVVGKENTGTFGDDSSSGPSSADVDKLEIMVSKSPGSEDIDLEEVTIQWIGPDGSVVITNSGTPSYSITDVKGLNSNVLDDSSDKAKLVIDMLGTNGADTTPEVIETGESVTLQITTPSGGTARIDLNVPESLSGESAVEL